MAAAMATTMAKVMATATMSMRTMMARKTTTARKTMAVAAAFLPNRHQSTICGSRRNGRGRQ
jgi:hypothetical protein